LSVEVLPSQLNHQDNFAYKAEPTSCISNLHQMSLTWRGMMDTCMFWRQESIVTIQTDAIIAIPMLIFGWTVLVALVSIGIHDLESKCWTFSYFRSHRALISWNYMPITGIWRGVVFARQRIQDGHFPKRLLRCEIPLINRIP
jgi:hypothetical protein